MMTADAVVKAEMTIVDAVVKGTGMITQIIMDATADQISVLNPVLNKGLLCSTRIRAADVKKLKITVATVKKHKDLYLKKCAGIFPAYFFNIRKTYET